MRRTGGLFRSTHGCNHGRNYDANDVDRVQGELYSSGQRSGEEKDDQARAQRRGLFTNDRW